MRRILLVLTMLMGVVFATAPLVAAQNDINVEGIGKKVVKADPQALLEALKTPIADADLPAAFSGAEFTDPDSATAEEGVLPSEDLQDTLGSVAYTINYDQSGGDAAATPAADLSAFSFGFASLNYVVFEDELGSKEMDEFKKGVEDSMTDSATPEAGASATEDMKVQDIKVGDADAVLITYITEEEGVQAAVQMVALPVGNVMIISMTVLASTEVDADALQADSEDLAVAGVEHLGTVAESAQ